MAALMSTQVRLKQRPSGLPGPETWDIATVPATSPGDGDIMVAVRYISLDPAMRGWLNDAPSYIPPVGLGEVMRAGAVGEVLESRAEGFAPGDLVSGAFGVQSVFTGSAKGVSRIDTGLAPMSTWLGGLGMPGMTAYFGLMDVGAYKPGDVVVVSAANGAVGSVVGQIAKIHGSKVIGIAGGPDKCQRVVERYGFDACIDYKAEKVGKRLRELAPDGLDVYFDNVGGEILEAALGNLKQKARIVICGAIANYNDMGAMTGPRNYLSLLVKSARMEGFVVFNYARRYAEGQAALGGWLKEGRIKFDEHVEAGLERFPEVLTMLFDGRNQAKLVLQV